MTLQEFSLVQQEDGRRALTSLVEHCMRRFLAAASLVEIGGPVVKCIQDARCEGNLDLTSLYPAWEIICERYRNERFDPQETFFKEHSDDVLERWGQFLHWELFPCLLRENEFVRNVLRATGLLACKSPEDAGSAVYHHISEMSLPYGRPPWDCAEIE